MIYNRENHLNKCNRDRLIRRKKRILAAQGSILFFLLILWTFAGLMNWITVSPLRSPVEFTVWAAQLLMNGTIISHIKSTVTAVLLSWSCGAAAGLLAGTGLWASKRISMLSRPYMNFWNSIPKIAVIPLFLILPVADWISIITACTILVFISASISIYNSFTRIDPNYVKIYKGLGLKKWRLFFTVIFPVSYPAILSVWKMNTRLAWTAIIAGEFLLNEEGIGHLLVESYKTANHELLILSLLILLLVSAVHYKLIKLLEKWIVRRN